MPNLVFLPVLDQLLPPVKALLVPDPVLPLAQVRVLDPLLLHSLAQVHLQAVALVPLQVLNLEERRRVTPPATLRAPALVCRLHHFSELQPESLADFGR
jgi:hypothetical protein